MDAFELGFFAIPVLDLEEAKAFYGEVMGWTFNDRDSNFSYILANEKMIGAFEIATKTLKPSQFGLLLYFRADFMGKTLERVAKFGGAVVERQALEGGARGYTARVEDPSMNVIGFWAAED